VANVWRNISTEWKVRYQEVKDMIFIYSVQYTHYIFSTVHDYIFSTVHDYIYSVQYTHA